mgnify:CR=1 FL=1
MAAHHALFINTLRVSTRRQYHSTAQRIAQGMALLSMPSCSVERHTTPQHRGLQYQSKCSSFCHVLASVLLEDLEGSMAALTPPRGCARSPSVAAAADVPSAARHHLWQHFRGLLL